MTQLSYDKNDTALLVVDPYNDFISEGGKIWPRIKAVEPSTRPFTANASVCSRPLSRRTRSANGRLACAAVLADMSLPSAR